MSSADFFNGLFETLTGCRPNGESTQAIRRSTEAHNLGKPSSTLGPATTVVEMRMVYRALDSLPHPFCPVVPGGDEVMR